MAGSNHKVDIIVGVKDLASRQLSNIQNKTENMSKNFGKVGTFVGAFNRNLDSTIGKMNRLANSMYKFNMYTSSLQRNLRNVALVGGVAAGGLAYSGINKALDFDYKSHIVQSRMEVSSKVRKEIEDFVLKDLNLRVGYSPNQIMDMGEVIGQAGINTASEMKALMETTSFFSEAVNAVPSEAAEMIISAAKGFNISMGDSSSITDKLTVALNQSLLHVEELPHAIGQLAGRAMMYGQSFDSSLVALMAMRDQGLSAAQGAQNFIHGLSSASRAGNNAVLFKRTKGYFNDLGINNNIFDMDTKKLKEYPEIVAALEQALVKQGFTNNKYGVKTLADMRALAEKNGGAVPEDIWNAMEMMPLMSKVFGKAGLAPILMGMNAKYEEVDKTTGEKTGKVYYGSEALKEMYKNVKNSEGQTEETHKIIEDAGKYQLQVLSGAWDSVQTKFFDQIVPIIKTGAEQLTGAFSDNLNNKKGNSESRYDAMAKAIEDAAKNLRENGNGGTATVVETLGATALNGVKIGGTMPSLFSQLGEGFKKNIMEGDWGNSLITFPWHVVKNGIRFLKDITKSNKEFNDAVEKLPKELQDPARLLEKLTKAGVALLITGAIVKVIELGVRGVSAALTGAKFVGNLTEAIIMMFTGKKGGKGGVIDKLLGKTINANIVNVYGKVVNGGGGMPGGGDTPGVPGGKKTPKAPKPNNAGKWISSPWGLIFLTTAAIDAFSGALGGPSVTIPLANKAIDAVQEHNKKKDEEKLDKAYEMYTNPKLTGPTELAPYTPQWYDKVKDFFTPKKVDAPASRTSDHRFVTDQYKFKGFGLEKYLPKEISRNDMDYFKNNYNEIVDKAKQQFNINGNIMDKFNSATDKLQNMQIQNNLSVNVAPPQVNITGDIKDYITVKSEGSSSFTTRENNNQTAYERMNNIMQKRLGWR